MWWFKNKKVEALSTSVSIMNEQIKQLKDLCLLLGGEIKTLEAEDGRLESEIDKINCIHDIMYRKVEPVYCLHTNRELCDRCDKIFSNDISLERIIEIKEEQLEQLKKEQELLKKDGFIKNE
jgi:hypothetical protein